MRNARRAFSWFAFATAALFAGCDDCPELSCGPQVVIRLYVPAGAIAGDTVTACRVDVCATATLPAAGAAGSSADLSFALAGVAGSMLTGAYGARQLVVSWMEGDTGDRFMLVVRDAAGVELAAVDEVATFGVASVTSGACFMCSRVALGDPA